METKKLGRPRKQAGRDALLDSLRDAVISQGSIGVVYKEIKNKRDKNRYKQDFTYSIGVRRFKEEHPEVKIRIGLVGDFMYVVWAKTVTKANSREEANNG